MVGISNRSQNMTKVTQPKPAMSQAGAGLSVSLEAHVRGPVKDTFTRAGGGHLRGDMKPPPLPEIRASAEAKLGGDAQKTAAQESRDVLNMPVHDVKRKDTGDREIMSDPPSANVDAPEEKHTAERNEEIKAQVQKNADVVNQKLATLSPEDQQRYQEMDAKLRSHNDDESRLSMQTMLLEDRLETKAMTELHRLSTSKKADGLEPKQDDKIFRETVREIAVPERINQGGRGTCAATVPIIKLAMEDPAEYARLMNGLSSPEGKVTTKGGVELTRTPGSETDNSGRTSTQRLLAPPLMDYANGYLEGYDNDRDQNQLGYVVDIGSGLMGHESEAAHDALFGHDTKELRRPQDISRLIAGPMMKDIGPQVGLKEIEEQLDQGKKVSVSLKWGDRDANGRTHGNHALLVTGVEVENGQKYVSYVNPWGQRERMKAEDFEKRLNHAHV